LEQCTSLEELVPEDGIHAHLGVDRNDSTSNLLVVQMPSVLGIQIRVDPVEVGVDFFQALPSRHVYSQSKIVVFSAITSLPRTAPLPGKLNAEHNVFTMGVHPSTSSTSSVYPSCRESASTAGEFDPDALAFLARDFADLVRLLGPGIAGEDVQDERSGMLKKGESK
jgi:hypothetical protein